MKNPLRMLCARSFSTSLKSSVFEPKGFGKNFNIPERSEPLKYEVLNKHPNDSFIQFDATDHVYFYKGKPLETSVTSFIESFFSKFDADSVIEKMKKKKTWPTPEYIVDEKELTTTEIKEKWEKIGMFARNNGTYMHYNIENFLNNLPYKDSTEMRYFKQFYDEYIVENNITTYRTEWRIAFPEFDLGGSIDYVGKMNNGNYVLVDWKRSKGLLDNLKNKYNVSASVPISHLDDCEGSKYSLQLNTYKYILEREYGLVVDKMFVVTLHPSLSTSVVVEVPDMKLDVIDMLNYYKANKNSINS